MKINSRILQTVLVLAFVVTHQIAVQAVVGNPHQSKVTSSVFDLPAEDIIQLDKKELAQKMNRSLTWKEKMAVNWVKRKAKKAKKGNNNQRLEHAKTSGMAVAGFVTGILGIVGGISLLFGILGIVFSAIALKRMRNNPELGGRGLAVAGLVMGIVAVVLFSSLFALAVAVF